MCVRASKAVGFEFAGVDLIREYGKAPNFYVTEVNGNPGTGIIDLVSYNHFADLIRHIEEKADQIANTPPDQSGDAAKPEQEASVAELEYRILASKDRNSESMSASQRGLLAFYRMKFGRVTV